MIAPAKEPVIVTQNLEVSYKKRFQRTVFKALHELDLEVRRGEIFGFIGPNGAGKSTTIKALLGFIFPASGTASVLGQPLGSMEAKSRLGYLPEVALYYKYLTAREILAMYGRLSGLSGSTLKSRVEETLKVVGLSDKSSILLSQFSKGMLQRVGLGQALIHDPELLILDEPASGLDPIGRHELRNIILELKSRGKTIFFSSHELSAVEALCDRVCILNKGRVVDYGDLNSILKPSERYTIRYRQEPGRPLSLSRMESLPLQEGVFQIRLGAGESANPAALAIIEQGGEILEITSERGTLEDYFMRVMRDTPAVLDPAEAQS